MTREINAVCFDLYEILITQFDPNWEPTPSPAERLGVSLEKLSTERLTAKIAEESYNFLDVLAAFALKLK